MNACQRHEPLLVEAAEGRRTPRLDLHLAGCPACRDRLDTLRADLVALTPDPAPAPGPWLATRIRARAEARRTRRTRLGLGLGGLAAAAATLFIALGWPHGSGLQGPVSEDAWAEVQSHLLAGPYGLGTGELPSGAALQAAEADTFQLEALEPDLFDPFAPTLGVDLEAELSHADEAELDSLLARLPG